MPYYHGTPTPGIRVLAPPPGKPLYLTNSRAYALFYIRDLGGAYPGRLRRYSAGNRGGYRAGQAILRRGAKIPFQTVY